MGWFRVLVLALVACNPKGLLLEVQGDNVELFIASGTAPCGSDTMLCPMTPPMQASGAAVTRLAKRWLQSTEQLVTPTKEVSGGLTRFLLETDQEVTLPALLAVSFDGPSATANVTGYIVAHDVSVPANKQQRMQLALDPGGMLTASSGIALWRKPSDTAPKLAPCVLTPQAHDATFPFESFSPPIDTDCDDFVGPAECNPFAAFGSSVPTDKELDCLLPFSAADPMALCKLGGPACVDGQPQTTNTCVAPRDSYCTYRGVCTVASGTVCKTVDCLASKLVMNVQDNLLGMHCTYEVDPSSFNPCVASGTTTSHVTAILPSSACNSARVAALEDPLAFGSSAMLSTRLKIDVQPKNTTDCSIGIDVELTGTLGDPVIGLVEIGAGITPHHHVFPIVIEPKAVCDGGPPLVCAPLVPPDTTDTIRNCQ